MYIAISNVKKKKVSMGFISISYLVGYILNTVYLGNTQIMLNNHLKINVKLSSINMVNAKVPNMNTVLLKIIKLASFPIYRLLTSV